MLFTISYSVYYKMLTSIFKAQIAALSLTLSLAEMDTKDYELIPPEPIRNVAKRGLALHQKFGKGKNAVLAEAIASEKSLSSKDIEKMLEFFNQFTPDREHPGWEEYENPSKGWIRWCMMGGGLGQQWAIDTKKMLEGNLQANFNQPNQV